MEYNQHKWVKVTSILIVENDLLTMHVINYALYSFHIFWTIFFRHVQVNNEGAIDFYKKFGFEIVETKQHYYKRIEPADAHVLQKTLRENGQANGIIE